MAAIHVQVCPDQTVMTPVCVSTVNGEVHFNGVAYSRLIRTPQDFLIYSLKTLPETELCCVCSHLVVKHSLLVLGGNPISVSDVSKHWEVWSAACDELPPVLHERSYTKRCFTSVKTPNVQEEEASEEDECVEEEDDEEDEEEFKEEEVDEEIIEELV